MCQYSFFQVFNNGLNQRSQIKWPHQMLSSSTAFTEKENDWIKTKCLILLILRILVIWAVILHAPDQVCYRLKLSKRWGNQSAGAVEIRRDDKCTKTDGLIQQHQQKAYGGFVSRKSSQYETKSKQRSTISLTHTHTHQADWQSASTPAVLNNTITTTRRPSEEKRALKWLHLKQKLSGRRTGPVWCAWTHEGPPLSCYIYSGSPSFRAPAARTKEPSPLEPSCSAVIKAPKSK